jgi:hypothetical protein
VIERPKHFGVPRARLLIPAGLYCKVPAAPFRQQPAWPVLRGQDLFCND